MSKGKSKKARISNKVYERVMGFCTDAEQERRFQSRVQDPTKRWKLSPMDLESRKKWVEYSRATDTMFAHTDIKQAPWYVVDADVKKHARLSLIRAGYRRCTEGVQRNKDRTGSTSI